MTRMPEMTVGTLAAALAVMMEEVPEIADLPVRMYSDAEGNDCHYLIEASVDIEHPGGPPLGLILVPMHGTVEGWY